jgi:hypothetical protein
MIEDPGSFSGIENSPIPQRGPEASHRISLAISIDDHFGFVDAVFVDMSAAGNLRVAGFFLA